MPFERIPISDREQWLALRKQDVTASAAGALLGVHPYQTAYGLAAEKLGLISDQVNESGAIRRGNKLEAVVIDEIKGAREWTVDKAGDYFRDPLARLGATPDTYAFDERGHGTVQIKTVADMVFSKRWKVDGEVALPPWIAIQANIEAHLMGAQWAAVAVLVVGFGWDLHIIDVPIHHGIIERVRAEVAAFWRLVDAGQLPEPDYGRDGAAIARLYADAVPGERVDLSADNRLPEILTRREVLKGQAKDAAEELAAIDAEIRAKIGEAESGFLPGWAITNKLIHRKEYVAKASSYRSLRITNLTAKEDAA